MKRLKEHLVYIGTKEESSLAINEEMKIVCALNRAKGFVTHQSVVGWSGRGCNPRDPHYLYMRNDYAIYLNMIDGNDPSYVSDIMIDAALEFIDYWVGENEKIFIYCSFGESRGPSIALMWLLENDLIERSGNTFKIFKEEYCRGYNPGRGNLLYIKRRWGV